MHYLLNACPDNAMFLWGVAVLELDSYPDLSPSSWIITTLNNLQQTLRLHDLSLEDLTVHVDNDLHLFGA